MATDSILHPSASGSSKVNVGQTERIVSAIGGALALLAGLKNIKSEPVSSVMQVVGGSFLLFRGATGYCPFSEAIGRDTANKKPQPITIKETLTINRPKDEVYNTWRKLENLPLFMQHLKSVKQLTNSRSHWEAQVPAGMGTIKWDAEIILEREGELLSWKSVEGALVDNAGEVTFKDAPGNRGTELHAVISYTPPAGDVGKLASKPLNGSFAQMVREDMRRFKRMIETGELPTIKNDPSARKKTELPLNP